MCSAGLARSSSVFYPRNFRGISSALRITPRRGHHRRMGRNATATAHLPLDEEVARPTFRRERSALKRGVWPVAGCDEASRSPQSAPATPT
jgi:hypothetical protein